MSLTTDPKDPKLKEGQQNKTGQHSIYLVLSDEELAKGFVRPYRDSYVHVGKAGYKPCGKNVRILEKGEDLSDKYYAVMCSSMTDKDSLHDENGKCISGAYMTKEEYDKAASGTYREKKGCGTKTSMGKTLSETYARDPNFYGATFCTGCNKHLPVDEFVWSSDNQTVGS